MERVASPEVMDVDQLGLIGSNHADWVGPWMSHVTGDLLYPVRQVAPMEAGLGVYRDPQRKVPFALVAGSNASVEGLQDAERHARKHDFEFAVAGVPGDSITVQLGPFEGETHRLRMLPMWLPSHPRKELIAKDVTLLPFRAEENLRKTVAVCHDLLYKDLANDPAAAFDILALVLAAKVFDETSDAPRYLFARVRPESADAAVDRFNQLVAAAAEWIGSQTNQSQTHVLRDLAPSTVERILELFQDYSLVLTAHSGTGKDVLGTAYEAIVGSTFRGELGSYFTPRTIADFMVRLLDVQGRVFDPASGTSGLLIAAKRHSASRGDEAESVDCFANDLNPRMVRTSKVNFLLHGMEPRQVVQGDGLQLDRMLSSWFPDIEIPDGVWLEAIPSGPFDAVLANPPFAGHEAESNLSRIETARVGGRLRSLNRTLPFLEVIVASLKEGGVAGLVLPTSILNAEEDSFRRLRHLMLEHTEIVAIVGLPEKAFVHTDCGVHGCLLFLRRTSSPRGEYDVFVDWAENLGYDRLGRYKRENDFPAILDRFHSAPWPSGNSFRLSDLQKYDRFDPAWLQVVESLPVDAGLEDGSYAPLTELISVVDRRISRKSIEDDGSYSYFEVGDADLQTGEILRVHETTGYELRKKGRIKNRVRAGDILLPNHRDSLIAKGAPTGRSAVIVPPELDGVLTTDRYLVLQGHYDALLIKLVLNSAGIRRQLVARSRGSASLDVRESILKEILVPRSLLKRSVASELIRDSEALVKLREKLQAASIGLADRIETEFGAKVDYRPVGSKHL